MANLTISGSVTRVLQTRTDSFEQEVDTNATYFGEKFNAVLDDFYYENYERFLVTYSVGKGYALGADGNVTFIGTNFPGYSGKLSSIAFSAYDGNWSVKGAMNWSTYNGIYNINLTSISIGNAASGLSMTGAFHINDEGMTGTYTSVTSYHQGMSWTYTGRVDVETGAGIVTSLVLRDGANGTLSLTGSFDALEIDQTMTTIGSLGDALHAPTLLAGNDVLTVTDASFDWHGYSGNDTITGGAFNDRLYGDDGDDILNGGLGADHMDGGNGNDTYYVDNVLDTITDNLGLSDIAIISLTAAGTTYTLGSGVEQGLLTGKAAINLTGNASANILTGNAAANILDGMLGGDTLKGGLGNDTYKVHSSSDQVIEENATALGGIDTVISDVDFTLGANVENLMLANDTGAIYGHGNGLANLVTGNGNDNMLYGWAGNDTLDGGAGADVMTGGMGNDIYYVDDANDHVVEDSAGGIDTVMASASFILAANVENLVMTATAGDIYAIGNMMANTLTGNAGHNRLDGDGGADILRGGAGNDIYSGDWTVSRGIVVLQDTIIENRNEGIDSVELRGQSNASSYATVTLGANLENMDISSTLSSLLNVNGNEWNNTLTGNDVGNVLNGGLGNDIMIGGGGDDLYVFNTLGDQVIEVGYINDRDTVQIAFNNLARSAVVVDMQAANLASVEIVRLTGTGLFDVRGTVNDDAIYGNASANHLEGKDGNDLLDGGAGADRLEGGDGNDTYIVDNVGDAVTDTSGIDTMIVRAAIGNFVLASGIENGTLEGTGAVNLIGNGGDNTLLGNDGANRLDGGMGADTMAGGLGNDIYIVDNAGDTATENFDTAKSGIDTVMSSVNFTLGANIENLVLTGSAMIAIGNALANSLTGNADNNLLDGAGGVDILRGGAGSDIYLVDLVATPTGLKLQDNIMENVNQGTYDRLTLRGEFLDMPASTIVLAANIEDFDASGTGATHLNLTGNVLNNYITGNDAANIIDGGLGNDDMEGGLGGDTYIFSNTGDHASEAANTGDDADTIDIRYANAGKMATLIDLNNIVYANIENLTLNNIGLFNVIGTADDNHLVGNASANMLDGGEGNNIIDGGLGADDMRGGAGVDIYLVDNVGDRITDAGGNDAVYVSMTAGTYVMQNGIEVGVITNGGTANLVGNAGDNDLRGGAGANVLDGGAGADYMAGGGGNDIYMVDNASDTVFESDPWLIGGIDTVKSTVTRALEDDIENLVLLGTSAINGTGNNHDNVVTGNSAANILTGGLGADTLNGGLGDDTYNVNLALDRRGTAQLEDTLVEGRTGGGTDTIILHGEIAGLVAASTLTLAADIENIDALDTGATWLNLTGNALANHLTGNDADNILNGGSGADIMAGNDGDDTYIFDNVDDQAIEAGGMGNDTLVIAYANLSRTDIRSLDLHAPEFANIENLTVTGNGLFNLTGDGHDNILTANTAASVLTGDGGADTYVLNSRLNQIVETSNIGPYDTDMVVIAYGNALKTAVTIDMTVPAYEFIENVTIRGAGLFNITGNDQDNILHGNASANVLDGGGGVNQLFGHGGNDTYIVDGHPVLIVEEDASLKTGGIDTVRSSVDFMLGANLENLVLTGTAIHGEGNDMANVITGNASNNILDGHGGVDTLYGGAGDDTFIVELVNAAGRLVKLGDSVIEYMDGGNDTIELHGTPLGATAYTTLTLGAYLEHLDASHTGSALLHLTGNAADNILTGNDIANTLNGGLGHDTLIGGGGLDTLYGGAGADDFVFTRDTAFGATDVIKDFNSVGGDRIDIRDLLTGYDAAQSHDFLQVTHNANGTSTLAVDSDGTGTAYEMHNVVSFNDTTAHGVTLDDLLNTNALLVQP